MGIKRKMPLASLETEYMRQQEISTRKAAKRRKLLIRRLSVFLILMVALSYLLITTIVSRGTVLEAKREEKSKLEETLAKLERKQTMLENEIVKLNDDDYIAKLARSEYFLSDKGEIIFNIPEPEKKEEQDEIPY